MWLADRMREHRRTEGMEKEGGPARVDHLPSLVLLARRGREMLISARRSRVRRSVEGSGDGYRWTTGTDVEPSRVPWDLLVPVPPPRNASTAFGESHTPNDVFVVERPSYRHGHDRPRARVLGARTRRKRCARLSGHAPPRRLCRMRWAGSLGRLPGGRSPRCLPTFGGLPIVSESLTAAWHSHKRIAAGGKHEKVRTRTRRCPACRGR